MTLPPASPDTGVERAEAKLAKLGVQVEAVQALLVRLLQDVVHAESRLESLDAARLVEVNEQLLVSAINSQVASEATAQALALAAESAAQDPLTGLPNRTTLLDRFMQATANTKRRGAQFALLFLDLDGFKPLNDTYGHAFGDQMLRLSAERMLSVVREVDTVSRHGGDEFVILLAELTRPEDASTVAEKLIAAISADAEIDGHTVRVTASVGIAIHPDHGEDFATLLACADAAMYESKRHRHGGVVIFDASMKSPLKENDAPDLPIRGPAVLGPDATHARLREANEKLVIAVIDAQELQAAAELARHQQTEFIKRVAAELLDPVAPIRIASAMLGRQSNDQHEQPLLPLVEGIVEKQITEMSRIVDKIVDASTIEKKPLMLDRARVDFAGIVHASAVGHQAMFESRDQRFDMRLPAGVLEVDGDAARLEQIIGNLLDNASRHTHNGGRIRLSVSTTPDTLVLTVADNGLGVTQQMLPYVFEPFVQDSHTLSLDGLGLGIGLTIARALAQAHGGSLVAYSAGANRGSQLVMTLPLAIGNAGFPSEAPPTGSATVADQGR